MAVELPPTRTSGSQGSPVIRFGKACRMNGQNRARANHGGDAVYGIGLIGALVYYIQQADGFWAVILGILKALVWPGFVVYDLLHFLGS